MPEQLQTASNKAVWGGVLLSIIGNIHWQDLLQSTILAAVGTIVSFGTSVLLKKWFAKKKHA